MTDATIQAAPRLAYRRLVGIFLLAGAIIVFMAWKNERMYWPFAILSYVLGGFAYSWESRRNPGVRTSSLLNHLFPKSIWAHPSTVNDAALALVMFLVVVLTEKKFSFAGHAAREIANFFAVHTQHFFPVMAPVPGTGVIIFYTAVSFIVSDLLYYVTHRLKHTVPVLWEFHKVHHSAPVMTPLTLYRVHPVDWIVEMLGVQVAILLTGSVFFYFYPGIHTVFVVAGFNGFVLLADFTGRNLRHTHIWLSFGRILEHIFVSPALHQIHHSVEKKHVDKNYGSIFSLWDWAFGSLYVPREKENITFGLGSAQADAPYQSVTAMLFYPFRQFMRKAEDT